MYSGQQTGRRPQAGMQPPTPCHSQIDGHAKEKLATYVYEYLILSGAAKSADVFKEEVLSTLPNSSAYKPSEVPPGFLQNWWTLFWDLYCAAPERCNQEGLGNPTQEARMYHEIGMGSPPYMPNPMMNGMHGPMQGFPGGPSMVMPGQEGMMPGHPGFSGRFAARGGPPMMGPGFSMMDPRMSGQRMPPNAMRIPSSPFPPGPGGMRPGAQGPPGMRFNGAFMDSPGQAFPPNAMMPNGGVMCSQTPMSMSSPGMPPGEHGGPSYMMGVMPSSSSSMPFGMGGDPSCVSLGNGGVMASSSMGDVPMTGMMNGEEMKQSPASTPRGVNGGTPAPGSAHSAPPVATPIVDSLEHSASAANKDEDMNEISRIKQGLMDDFAPQVPKEEEAVTAGTGDFGGF